MQKSVPVELRYMVVEEAIAKAKKIVEGYPETKFTAEEYTRFHECVYSLVVFYPGTDKWLFEKFKKTLEETIILTVLPSLTIKKHAILLGELVQMWLNYKKMARFLSRFFEYLDRFYIPRVMGVVYSLAAMSVQFFQDLVFNQLFSEFLAAAILLINQERDGEQVDWNLLRNVMDMFMEIDGHRNTTYYKDFEHAMLADTAAYYSRLASQWLLYDSLADYTLKVRWCMDREKERGSHYIRPSSVEKLLVVVRCQLLDQNASLLVKKQQAEDCGMVTDYQEILSKCTNMSLQEGGSVEEWLSDLMARATHIC